MSFRTIEWRDNKVVMIDQTRLPGEEVYNEYSDFKSVAEAIRGMVIRGAPAIGVAAAMGVALGARDIVLKEVVRGLPVDTIEVVPRTVDLGLFRVGTGALPP